MTAEPEIGHDPIFVYTDEIKPSPENDKLYRPIQDDDPEVVALADSILEHGILEPLVVSQDGYILSGHRRMKAKTGSTNYKKFVKRYGSDLVYELEAVQPGQLQKIVRDAIDSVIDVAAFNAEVDREREDAGYLQGVRLRLLKVLPEDLS